MLISKTEYDVLKKTTFKFYVVYYYKREGYQVQDSGFGFAYVFSTERKLKESDLEFIRRMLKNERNDYTHIVITDWKELESE